MNNKFLIIIGFIVISIVSISTFSVFVLNDQQNLPESVNLPQPGEKYYIEPTKLAELEKIELDLRTKIAELHKRNNLDTGYGVNLNHLTQEIEIVVETKTLNPEIEEIISQNSDKISISYTSGVFYMIDQFESQNFSNSDTTLEEFNGVIMDMTLGGGHSYHFFTNELFKIFNTGSNGVTLEGVNHIENLHGKQVKLLGVRTDRDLGIQVQKLEIQDSLIPKGEPFGKVVRSVTIDDLYQNPDKFYNQIILVSGDLSEYEHPLAYAGVGCTTTKYITSDIFVPDFPSTRHLHEGEKKVGVRIGTHDDLGMAESFNLPDEMKNNRVEVRGVFVPNIVKTGSCDHVLSKSGYVLTTMDDIIIVDDSFSYDQKCANLFDNAFDTWGKYVDENYGGSGQPILEPPQVDWIISGWEGGKEFRESDCRFTVNDWAYLVNHQEQVWGYIDWPELKPYS